MQIRANAISLTKFTGEQLAVLVHTLEIRDVHDLASDLLRDEPGALPS